MIINVLKEISKVMGLNYGRILQTTLTAPIIFFIASALGNKGTNFTWLFMYVFHHAVSQLKTLLGGKNGKPKG